MIGLVLGIQLLMLSTVLGIEAFMLRAVLAPEAPGTRGNRAWACGVPLIHPQRVGT